MTTEPARLPSQDGACAAWVTLPDGHGPHPAVVLVHGFGATHEMALHNYEERFSAAGFAVVAFDYRNNGDSPGEPRQFFSVRRMLADVHAAITYAGAHPEIDPTRIALWGTSFGASHVITTAAHDRRVAAAVVQCPMIATLGSTLGLGVTHLLRLTPPITQDLLRRATGRPPRYVPIAGRPGETAMVATAGAYEGWHGLVPQTAPFDNRTNAAMALDFLTYRVDRQARHVQCPLLVCVSDRENLMDPAIATKIAADAPHGEAIHYDADHWTVYQQPQLDQLTADQTRFLTQHLTPVPASRSTGSAEPSVTPSTPHASPGARSELPSRS
jgi:pimeloyl-ACP methyl ester carboxylesterase